MQPSDIKLLTAVLALLGGTFALTASIISFMNGRLREASSDQARFYIYIASARLLEAVVWGVGCFLWVAGFREYGNFVFVIALAIDILAFAYIRGPAGRSEILMLVFSFTAVALFLVLELIEGIVENLSSLVEAFS